jgi:hypothetical protein
VAWAIVPAVAASAIAAALALGARSNVPDGAVSSLLLASVVTGAGAFVGFFVSRRLTGPA